MRAFDQYAQLEWSPVPRAALMAGVRHSEIRFSAEDHYIRSGNPDDSGSADYGATVPVASVLWRATDRLHFYAALGQGFETPTLVELAYRTDGRAGLNFDLSPARTRQAGSGHEVSRPGRRSTPSWRCSARARERELVVAANAGGRAAYANAGRTEREGVEVSVSGNPAARLGWQLAWTALRRHGARCLQHLQQHALRGTEQPRARRQPAGGRARLAVFAGDRPGARRRAGGWR